MMKGGPEAARSCQHFVRSAPLSAAHWRGVRQRERSVAYRTGEGVILVSAVLALLGLVRLVAARRWVKALFFLGLMAAYPFLFHLVSKAPDHMRWPWLAVPMAVLGPVWLMLGFFVSRAADDAEAPLP